MKFIYKALNHKSPVISSVAKISIQNSWSNCSGNYSHIMLCKLQSLFVICFEYNIHEDVSASAVGRVWQAGVSDKRISDVSVLSDMIDVRNLAMMMLTMLLLK